MKKRYILEIEMEDEDSEHFDPCEWLAEAPCVISYEGGEDENGNPLPEYQIWLKRYSFEEITT
jgi:hypothetical protein